MSSLQLLSSINTPLCKHIPVEASGQDRTIVCERCGDVLDDAEWMHDMHGGVSVVKDGEMPRLSGLKFSLRGRGSDQKASRNGDGASLKQPTFGLSKTAMDYISRVCRVFRSSHDLEASVQYAVRQFQRLWTEEERQRRRDRNTNNTPKASNEPRVIQSRTTFPKPPFILKNVVTATAFILLSEQSMASSLTPLSAVLDCNVRSLFRTYRYLYHVRLEERLRVRDGRSEGGDAAMVQEGEMMSRESMVPVDPIVWLEPITITVLKASPKIIPLSWNETPEYDRKLSQTLHRAYTIATYARGNMGATIGVRPFGWILGVVLIAMESMLEENVIRSYNETDKTFESRARNLGKLSTKEVTRACAYVTEEMMRSQPWNGLVVCSPTRVMDRMREYREMMKQYAMMECGIPEEMLKERWHTLSGMILDWMHERMEKVGKELAKKERDNESGDWQDVSSEYDSEEGVYQRKTEETRELVHQWNVEKMQEQRRLELNARVKRKRTMAMVNGSGESVTDHGMGVTPALLAQEAMVSQQRISSDASTATEKQPDARPFMYKRSRYSDTIPTTYPFYSTTVYERRQAELKQRKDCLVVAKYYLEQQSAANRPCVCDASALTSDTIIPLPLLGELLELGATEAEFLSMEPWTQKGLLEWRDRLKRKTKPVLSTQELDEFVASVLRSPAEVEVLKKFIEGR